MTEELDIKYQESFEFDDYIPYFDDIINVSYTKILLLILILTSIYINFNIII